VVFVHFVIQHARRMRRILFSSVTGLPLLYFLHYFIYGMVIEKNWTQNMLLHFLYKVCLKHF